MRAFFQRQRGRRGFTLVEVMIVVAIIGLLAVIALPSLIRARQDTQRNAFINDLRIARDAFELFAINRGYFPEDRWPGIIPDGMDEYLTKFRWDEPTPIGGYWDWDNGQFGFRAGISVFQPDRTPAEMREIDRRIDDGNLSTGAFRQRNSGYIWILEP